MCPVFLLSLSLILADDPTKGVRVSGKLDGTAVSFTEGDRQMLANAVLDLLESCCFSLEMTNAEWAKSTSGDHLRIVLPRPVKVSADDQQVETKELILVLPLGRGSIRFVSGEKAYLFTKYTFQTSQQVEKVLEKAKPIQPDDRTK